MKLAAIAEHDCVINRSPRVRDQRKPIDRKDQRDYYGKSVLKPPSIRILHVDNRQRQRRGEDIRHPLPEFGSIYQRVRTTLLVFV